MTFRILHVDDEPDIRVVVELSLALDPQFAVRSCACGAAALVEAADWSPHLVLCDVMMPVMDGPEVLARLRGSPRTAAIPVVFLTARAQHAEVEHLRSLGATGVIAKPFDPLSLADTVREYLRFVTFSKVNDGFRERLRGDAALLAGLRAAMRNQPAPSGTLDELQSTAHKLSGAAGIFGFRSVSHAAAALEDSVVDRRCGRGSPGRVEADLDALVGCIGHELGEARLELAS